MDININATAVLVVTGNIRSTRTRTSRSGDEIFEISVPVGGRDDDAPDTWYRVPFFGERAQASKGRLNKGDLVQITGEPEISAYESQNGPAASVDIPFARVSKLRNASTDTDDSADDSAGDVEF